MTDLRKRKFVVVKRKHFKDVEEIYEDIYKCPVCSSDLFSYFKFCPDCGIRLRWSKEITDN